MANRVFEKKIKMAAIFILFFYLFIFFLNAVRRIGGSYQPISVIFNSKQWKTTFYPVFNFEDNQSKIATVRVRQRKVSKMAAMTSSFRIFKIREKGPRKYLSDHL